MFDQSEMMPRKEVELKELAKKFQEKLPKKIIIEGHADLWGEEAYNGNLSEERAINVKEYLIKLGVPEEIIETN